MGIEGGVCALSPYVIKKCNLERREQSSDAEILERRIGEGSQNEGEKKGATKVSPQEKKQWAAETREKYRQAQDGVNFTYFSKREARWHRITKGGGRCGGQRALAVCDRNNQVNSLSRRETPHHYRGRGERMRQMGEGISKYVA